MYVKAAQFANLLMTGLLSGIYVRDVLSASSVRRLSGPTYTQYHQELDRTMAVVMPPIAQSTLLTSMILIVLGRRRSVSSVGFSIAGLGCLIAQIGVTLGYEVPINKSIQSWSPTTPPDDWEQTRERWIQGHQIRTVLGVSGLACQIIAALE